MKKINFEKMLVAMDVARKHCINRDYREDFANAIWQSNFGIAAFVLAEKIYKSEGETEYDEKEVKIIQQVANRLPPFFIDALNRAINNQPEEATNKQE